MRNPIIVIIVFFGCLIACQPKNETLFFLVDPGDSNLDFKNTLYQSDKLNIINLDYFYNGGGVAVGDFNKDGLNDLFFTGNMVPNKLYLNKGDLEFEDISDEAGIAGFDQWKSGVAVADINSDGWADIYVCSTISQDSTRRRNMMFINQGLSEDGHPTFINMAAEMGIDDDGYSANAGFLDYDNDGDLDLYILTNSRQTGPVNYRPKVNDGTSVNTDKLFRNNGNGTFTNVSQAAGIICEGYGLGIAFLDVNKDGWTDIYVGNDYITNDLLYINHQGTFVNEIDNYIKHQSKFSMGNDVADINNDGFLDIITVDMLPDNNLRKKTVISGSGYTTYINDERFDYTHQYVRNMLQLNNGNQSFSEIGQLSGVYQTEWSWSPLFADFDNDGHRDLVITNGFPKDITDRDFISFREKSLGIAGVDYLLSQVPSVKVPNIAFKNNGDLTFSDVTKQWGLDQPSFSNGAAYADLDNDGDLDYVVNNIDEFVSLYENRLYTGREKNNTGNHYLRIKLKGPKENRSALGAKVTLRYNSKMQFAEHSVYRGYISTVEDAIHFGTGETTIIDTVTIEWPDQNIQVLTNVKTDQMMAVEYNPGQGNDQPSLITENTLLKDLTKQFQFPYKHKEDVKIDFNVQRTLQRKLTQRGPALAVGDVNGDGLEDFCVGGSADSPTQLFLRNKQGTFSASPLIKGTPKVEEDAGILLFDADNDKDLDLYAVSGSYEFDPGSKNLQDRLYINDGKGNFQNSIKSLPGMASSGSCVRAADFDGDNDLDLFIGGHVPLGKYPFADDSYILVNNNGIFTNATKELCPDLINPGIVTDAIWTDFNNDKKIDLIVVGEFMPVTFFTNTGNGFEKSDLTGIEKNSGWFNSINGGDFDADGDTDYVVGNLGLNNYYNASADHPVKLCAKDFDSNGSIDAILSCFIKSENGTMESYPVHFWDELNSQSPKFRKQFSSYAQFAKTTTGEFFKPEELKDALVLEANFMSTGYIENLGGGKFQMKAFSLPVQTAPVNGIVVDYLNEDQNLDILLVGNDFNNEPTYGQYDAFTGMVLIGDGKGNFDAIPSVKSGFVVDGDARGLVKVNHPERSLYIATQNLDSLKVHAVERFFGNFTFQPDVFDSWAEMTFGNGKKVRVEFYYGAGYLSQSTRSVSMPKAIRDLTIYDSKGNARKVIPQGGF